MKAAPPAARTTQQSRARSSFRWHGNPGDRTWLPATSSTPGQGTAKTTYKKKKPEHKAKYTSITTQHPHPKGSKQTLEPRECTTYTHQGNRQSTPRTRHYKQCLPQASPQLLPRGQYSSQPGMRAFFSRQPLCQDLRKVNTSAVLNLTNATDHNKQLPEPFREHFTPLTQSSIPPGADPPHTELKSKYTITHTQDGLASPGTRSQPQAKGHRLPHSIGSQHQDP